MSKVVEVFTAGSYLCNDVVEQVKNLACPKCEIVIYDLNEKNSNTVWEQKSKAYGIQSIPTVTIDGKIVDLYKLRATK